MWPKVSIIIPIYNREVFVKPALNSIFKQNYPKNKIEVLLVDAGSTDRTLEFAKKYPVRIIHIDDPLAKKIGEPGKVLGYKKMTGEFYFYLDSDAEFVSKNFIRDLIYPFIDDKTIAGSFTRYMPSRKQTTFNRYVSNNELQLWGMLAYLLPKIKDVIVERREKYDVVEIDPEKSPPIGMAFFRKKFLEKVIHNPDKFNYVDIAIPLQLAEVGYKHFAYVENAGMIHRRDGLKREIFRAKRDVTVTYLPVFGERKFNYIDFKKKRDIWRIILWVVYVNLVLPSLIAGIYKSIKWHDLAGLYELPTNLLLTDYVIWLFLSHERGRKIIIGVLKDLLIN